MNEGCSLKARCRVLKEHLFFGYGYTIDNKSGMSMKPYRILIVDDEKKLAWDLARSLKDDGYEVMTAQGGAQALENARHHEFDLIMLDVAMPGMDGLNVCRELRQSSSSSSVPIMLLSTLSSIIDRVKGLDHGGDDYVVKPFDISELKARARALLRRRGFERGKTAKTEHRKSVLNAGPFSLWLKTSEVRIGTSVAKLTPREFDLLHYLMLHSGEIVSSRQLLQTVWGYPADSSCTNVVRWHVKSLREKIEPNPGCPVYLRTVPHQGYILKAEPLSEQSKPHTARKTNETLTLSSIELRTG